MATTGTYTYSKTAFQVIKRALRIVNGYSQGEQPSLLAVTDALEVLNDLSKEWQTDGMALWKVANVVVPLVAGQQSYTIGLGGTYNVTSAPPLKVINAFLVNTSVTPNSRIPIIVVTRSDYELIGNFLAQGKPNQVWYNPVGVLDNATGQPFGTVTMYSVPDTGNAAQFQLELTGMMPYDDYTDPTGADSVSFPQHWYNALVWGLADQISIEYGVPIDQQGQIQQRMVFHKGVASSFDEEEGSFYIQAAPNYAHQYNGR